MIDLRPMTAADVSFGMRLKDQAGWNQTRADWQRFLALQPDGCFVALLDATPAGTVATFEFDSVAWIAMVLVEQAMRGQGVGTRLVQFALEHLDGRGVRSIRLDATELGRPIYEKLGFVAEYELARLEGKARPCDPSPKAVAAPAESLDAVCALDLKGTGTNRRRLLEHLQREQGPRVWLALDGSPGENVLGYATCREGSRATQIGPAVAVEPEAGRDLMETAFGACAGRSVFLDVPLPNGPAVAWARSRGLALQRHFTRMGRGEPVDDRPEMIWASSGPEKG